jgi:hypothetical protein
VDYGQLQLDTEAVPLSYNPGTHPSLRVVNNGNVAEDLLIRGADATAPAGGTWTLSNTTVGVNQYMHLFGPGQTPAPLDYLPLSGSEGSSLMGNVLAGTPVDFNLKIHTPTASTVFGQYSTKVTVVAMASTP